MADHAEKIADRLIELQHAVRQPIGNDLVGARHEFVSAVRAALRAVCGHCEGGGRIGTPVGGRVEWRARPCSDGAALPAPSQEAPDAGKQEAAETGWNEEGHIRLCRCGVMPYITLSGDEVFIGCNPCGVEFTCPNILEAIETWNAIGPPAPPAAEESSPEPSVTGNAERLLAMSRHRIERCAQAPEAPPEERGEHPNLLHLGGGLWFAAREEKEDPIKEALADALSATRYVQRSRDFANVPWAALEAKLAAAFEARLAAALNGEADGEVERLRRENARLVAELAEANVELMVHGERRAETAAHVVGKKRKGGGRDEPLHYYLVGPRRETEAEALADLARWEGQQEGEPVHPEAWVRSDGQLTLEAREAGRWDADGWKVDPLYAAPPPAAPSDESELRKAVRNLLALRALTLRNGQCTSCGAPVAEWDHHPYCRWVRLRAALDAAPVAAPPGEPAALHHLRFDRETLCPECGLGVSVDEDGSCVQCGGAATGSAVAGIHGSMRQLELYRKQCENEAAPGEPLPWPCTCGRDEKCSRCAAPPSPVSDGVELAGDHRHYYAGEPPQAVAAELRWLVKRDSEARHIGRFVRREDAHEVQSALDLAAALRGLFGMPTAERDLDGPELFRRVQALEAAAPPAVETEGPKVEEARSKALRWYRQACRLEGVIRWALGERGDFGPRPDGEGAYWWRKVLRGKLQEVLAAEPPPGSPPAVEPPPEGEQPFRVEGHGWDWHVETLAGERVTGVVPEQLAGEYRDRLNRLFAARLAAPPPAMSEEVRLVKLTTVGLALAEEAERVALAARDDGQKLTHLERMVREFRFVAALDRAGQGGEVRDA